VANLLYAGILTPTSVSPYVDSITGDISFGSNIILNVSSTANLIEGLVLIGNANIPLNTTIVSVDGPSQITINNVATGSETAGASDIYCPTDKFFVSDSSVYEVNGLFDATYIQVGWLVYGGSEGYSGRALRFRISEIKSAVGSTIKFFMAYDAPGGLNSEIPSLSVWVVCEPSAVNLLGVYISSTNYPNISFDGYLIENEEVRRVLDHLSITGIQGATGPYGVGTTGLQGLTGILGIDGQTGLQGLTGILGIDGQTGVQGATGLTVPYTLTSPHMPFFDGTQLQDSSVHFVAGYVGIDSTAPAAKLTMSNGSVDIWGTTGANPFVWDGTTNTRGAGNGIIFVGNKGACMIGNSLGYEWSDAFVGTGSFSAGTYNYAPGGAAIALGYLNYAAGSQSIAGGSRSATNGGGIIALGRRANTSGSWSHAYGNVISSTANNSMIIGSGVLSPEKFLTNDKTNSLMIGFNSELPTVFVQGADGTGTRGKVGIDTTSPLWPLDVSGGINTNTGYYLNGVPFTSGITGIAGVAGATGIQGDNQGTTGYGGITGFQGLTGAGGLNSTGIQGITGVSVPGLTGFQGVTGLMGAGSTGLQGYTGIGPQGSTGVGLQGLTGGTGLQGSTGVGPQGSTGVGPQGSTGSTGIQGYTGIGPQGSTGLQGSGITGVQGPTGIQGIGIQGSTGFNGHTGVQGATGLYGPTGILGSTGLRGFTGFGIQGITGIQGVTGLSVQGITGSQGLQGITGTSISVLNFSMSAGIGSVPTGIMGQTVLAFNSYFDSWTLLSDSSSSIKLDVQKSTYANYPSTTSMHGSTGVFINSAYKNTGTTASWSDNSGASGDVIKVILTGTDGTASKISLLLKFAPF
jgi:hypothetical protein